MAGPYGENNGNARGVLQIDERGAMPFDTVNDAAEEAGMSRGAFRKWIGDGKIHNGFRYEWEQAKG